MHQIKQRLSLLILFQGLALLLYAKSIGFPLFFDSKSVLLHADLSGNLRFERLFSGRWLTELSFGLVSALYGSEWFYQNLFNVILHAINAFLLFELLLLIYTEVLQDAPRVTSWQLKLMALAAGLIFLVHPVSVYATAYLIQRSILLGTGLSLLSLILFIRGLLSASRKLLVLAPAAYLMALMAKENCIMLPGAALVLMHVCDDVRFRFNLKQFFWVFVLFGIAACPVLMQKIGIIGAVYEPYAEDMIHTYEFTTRVKFDLSQAYGFSILTQCYMFFRYVLVWILPLPQWLSIDLHFPFAMSWLSWPESVSIFLYLVIFSISIWMLRRKSSFKLVAAACIVPMILFATEFSVVRLSEQFVLYRSYFWMGFLGLAIPPFYIFLNRYVHSTRMIAALVLGVILIFSTVASDRLQTFQSEVAVWEDALSKVTKDPGSSEYFKTHRVHQNLAVAYDLAGNLDKSLWHYQQAIQIHPKLYPAHDNLGMLYLKLKQPERALAHFKVVYGLKPTDAENVYNMGVANEALNNPEQAISDYTAAIKLRPDYVEAYNNLGACFMKIHDYQRAKSALEAALKFRPDFAVAFFNLGTLSLKLHDYDSAVNYLQRAKFLGLNDESLLNNLRIAERRRQSSH